MSSGRKRIMCPECGQPKPNHDLGCRFGLALAQGRERASVDAMHPQVRRLWDVVAAQFAKPVSLTDAGVSDLVTRITRDVVDHLGLTGDAMDQMLERGMIRTDHCPECGEPYRTVLAGTPDEGRSCTHKSGCTWVWTRSPESQQRFPQEYVAATGSSVGTVDGIRPHRPVTEQQDARMRRTAEQWEAGNPMTPERAAALAAGRHSPTSCIACGQPWINAEIRHLPDCPGLRPVRPCSVLDKAHSAHGWPDGDVMRQCPGVLISGGCPGCGQLPVQGRNGRATLHLASCTVARERAPQVPSADS